MNSGQARPGSSQSGKVSHVFRLKRTGKALALAVLLSASPALASFAVPPNAPGQYAPRDDCSAQPGGKAFLAALKSAVAKRDAAALASLSAPDVVLDFGGGSGREEMISRLVPGSGLWEELDKLILLGCAFDEDNAALVLPWFFAQDLGDSDPYGTSVTLGKAIPLREGPQPTSAVRKVLDWQLVFVRESDDIGSPLVPVAVIDSELEGYVELAKLRSQLDYRVRAERKGGRWQITAFVAGE